MLDYSKNVNGRELALTLLAHQLHVGPKVLSISRADGHRWTMVTEYGGKMLSELSWEERLDVKLEALKQLKRLHQGGILHADITEENIVVDNGMVHIIDYGLAMPCSPSLDVISIAREVFDVELVNAKLEDLFEMEQKEMERLF